MTTDRTPEEHYERGLRLLAQAETDFGYENWNRASVNAVIAQSHFSAAAAGNAMRAFDAIYRTETAAGEDAHTDGRRNVHCSNCGDTRGGPVGHETSECTHDSKAAARTAETES